MRCDSREAAMSAPLASATRPSEPTAHAYLYSRALIERWTFAIAGALYIAFILRGAVMIDGQAYFTLFDDAMISMRYARTLADGGGLSWNPGDTPVEGVT